MCECVNARVDVAPRLHVFKWSLALNCDQGLVISLQATRWQQKDLCPRVALWVSDMHVLSCDAIFQSANQSCLYLHLLYSRICLPLHPEWSDSGLYHLELPSCLKNGIFLFNQIRFSVPPTSNVSSLQLHHDRCFFIPLLCLSATISPSHFCFLYLQPAHHLLPLVPLSSHNPQDPPSLTLGHLANS